MEGLRLGNKLKMAHVRWEKQKMKVKHAAQVFSSSVADALEYCNTQLHLPQFSGCEETVKFLRIIDENHSMSLTAGTLWGRGPKPQ